MLVLASSGFAYALGRQQGEQEAHEGVATRLEAMRPALTGQADDEEGTRAGIDTAREGDDAQTRFGRRGTVASSRHGFPSAMNRE